MWRSVSQCDVLCRIVTCGACHVVMKAACTSRAVLLRADLRSLWIHHAFCTPSGYIMRSALPLDTSCVHHTSCRVLFCCMRTCAPSGYIMRLCDCVSRFVCAQMIGESCYVSTVVECAVFAQHLCRATPPLRVGARGAVKCCVYVCRVWHRGAGKLHWNFFTRQQSHAGVVLGSGLIFFGDDSGWVYALQPETGTLVWEAFVSAAR